jgi:urea transport system permease protein
MNLPAIRQRYSVVIFLIYGFLLLILPMSSYAQSNSEQTSLVAIAQQLVDAKLREVASIIDDLEAKGGEQVLPLFEAMVAGNLYYQLDDRRLVYIIGSDNDEVTVKDVFDSQVSTAVNKNTLSKIKTNNRLRSDLKTKIATLTLFSKSVERRKKAVSNF